ncbi:MAG: ATP--guanido phosphotransferase [Clostridia bacterium]|nr:ATP--guanido phosphotransferase [Clostridia bacterium]
MKKWYESADNGDKALSARVRLARNLNDHPFPSKLDDHGRKQVIDEVRRAFADSAPELDYYDMRELSREAALSLAERHLISPEFALDERSGGLLISRDESVSIMLCEEEHIKIQAFRPGGNVKDAYKAAQGPDRIVGSVLNVAFDDRLGYLTQSPANLGTGMRASVLMHLPALSKSGQIQRLAGTLAKMGMTMNGVYGGSGKANGDIYRIANTVTLGISENEALGNLDSVAMQLATRERAAAEALTESVSIQDKIHRAYGILETARLLSADEMLDLFSWVRLGTDGGIISADTSVLNELILTLQAATLSLTNGGVTDVDERDALRARTVKERLFK